MPVSFTVPTATGGQAPVTVTCSSQSGANFPLGSTVVTCTATDSLQRTATCNFNVAVTPSPRISKTKFLGFGDSITYGRCGPGGRECTPYTSRLSELLSARYQRQSLTVIRSGIPGEVASDDIAEALGHPTNGQDRVGPELQQYGSDVLLLMEGTNDLFFGRAAGITPALQALGRMIDIAQARNITVFIATIPPQRLGGARDEVARLIPGFNDQLRVMATARGANVVDVYGALVADVGRYISEDDLHPTAEGLRLIGETFFAAIRAKLDSTPTSTSSSLFTRR
jgi:lysophospholipase L1-like esterase